jgi:hypothetical protein
METTSEKLLADLKSRTEYCIHKAQELSEISEEKLRLKPAPNAWNALECFEHLNYYTDFYHPEIKKKMSRSHHSSQPDFSSGWLGKKFIKAVDPQSKPMKTLKKTDPLTRNEPVKSPSVISRFLADQQEMLEIITAAKSKNLNKVKVGISIAPWLKVKLGDAITFTVLHNQRHIQQAARAARIQE